jgi:hypothetical protein
MGTIKKDKGLAQWAEEYRRRNERTLEEQKEDEATMTLDELDFERGRLAHILKDLAQYLPYEVDDCIAPDEEEHLIQQIKNGDEEPFVLDEDAADAANDFPIYLRQWKEAVNAVLRRKAQMVGNGAPTLDEVE